ASVDRSCSASRCSWRPTSLKRSRMICQPLVLACSPASCWCVPSSAGRLCWKSKGGGRGSESPPPCHRVLGREEIASIEKYDSPAPDQGDIRATLCAVAILTALGAIIAP